MADDEHLEILRRGVEAWNAWRREYRQITPDLSGTDFRGQDLRQYDIRGTNLVGVNLENSSLRGVNLRSADLRKANLRSAFLSRANLREARLCEANLVTADLIEADLSRASLKKARLNEALLIETNLSRADLSAANLTGAELRGANLSGANLDSADFQWAELYATILTNVSLSTVAGLETCRHLGPSMVDHQTLVRSGVISLNFWQGCGLPDALIDYMPSLTGDAIQFYSCFISYSSKDQEFADRLHADLQSKGVRCWFAPHDLPIGSKTWDSIDEAIRTRDKVLLILSESAIASDWVEDEVTKAFSEERRRLELVLFPIRLDEAVMKTAEAWAGKLRDNRNIGDFTLWKEHDAYKATFDRVLRDLKI